MSPARKPDDGAFFTGSASLTKWGNTRSHEVKADKYASTKRARKNFKVSEYEESPFHESGEKDRYLITYADLITLLLGLFILLYTASNLDVKKYENMLNAIGNVFGTNTNIKIVEEKSGSSEIVVSPLDKLKKDVSNIISENNYGNSVKIEENERGVTIHILEDIVFASGDAALKKSSKIVLHKIASVIKELPNDIRIEGHTDNVPIKSALFPSNWHLSVARALNTAYYLIEEENLSPDKVSIVGYSEYKPIESNETIYGRAANRRVDIVIIKK